MYMIYTIIRARYVYDSRYCYVFYHADELITSLVLSKSYLVSATKPTTVHFSRLVLEKGTQIVVVH